MGQALSVEVRDRDGEPLSGVTVEIVIDGFFTGGGLEETTNRDGHAEFETADDYEPYRQLRIHVGGQSFGPYRISDGAYTVQLE
ncbi:MAG: hypothetical protein EPO07_07730 [Verrucomicrobia bacterium]|nr:MAG: hypothetical protein EPO07_07730 [Verrucomicrobiota bacterium]